jgi:hypothetical protein
MVVAEGEGEALGRAQRAKIIGAEISHRGSNRPSLLKIQLSIE